MLTGLKEQKTALIEQAVLLLKKRVEAADLAIAERFLRFYYAAVPPEDLRARAPGDLCGAALCHLELARRRTPGQPKIRVYNPSPERHGWHSTHSIVEVVNDDMPFLVDSLIAALNEMSLTNHLVIHPIYRVEHNATGDLLDLTPVREGGERGLRESFIHAEIDQRSNDGALKEIEDQIATVLAEVRIAVADWRAMLERLEETVDALERNPPPVPAEQAAEVADFLRWVGDNRFTFLGYCAYALDERDGQPLYRAERKDALGLLRDARFDEITGVAGEAPLPPEVRNFVAAPRVLMITKSKRHSPVHRPAPMDSIGVKTFGAGGRVTGERRFLGLFTSTAYNASPLEIPLLRRRVLLTVENSGFAPDSHDGKALLNILETFPRDELFQISSEELFDISLGILHLQERQRTRLFVRRDPYERHVSCLVYVPRDRFDTDLRVRIQEILIESFKGTKASFAVQVSDEALARLHFVIETVPGQIPAYDAEAIERRLAEAVQTWSDALHEALIARFGESRGVELSRRYREAFPTGYREEYATALALDDVENIESISPEPGGRDFAMNLYSPFEGTPGLVKFKLYRADDPVPLSDVLPLLENMGFRVIGERQALVEPEGRRPVWIHDFNMVMREAGAIEVGRVRENFHDAFAHVWTGAMENDGFNRLVVQAGLDWREIVVLRALCKYLRQAGIPFSQQYMEETLVRNAPLARRLVELFLVRFDPVAVADRAARTKALEDEILSGLEAVAALDEDRILRRYLNLIQAMLRTNYFQTDSGGRPKPYLAFKLNSAAVEELPLPRPYAEIFVYSPRMEGVHLRGGKVARGGIRWSDRREDFRTEILSLMKAQMVKNAVIVPVGAKGGFVCKRLPEDGARDAVQEEGIACYRTLIDGLLDLTDNLKGDRVESPAQGLRYDDDDPYLVVAADKGTATFSDIANAIALERGFWLGDAFASGGATGYDHKKMGITARGAWVSVRRHLREAGLDPERQSFTVVGIGDMSGDVFGNGMLRSDKIKLVAAFNHRHIFLDPDPDPAKSFAERKRLFELPRSSWSDYDAAAISPGGGVFERKVKAIRLSPEVRQRFGIRQDSVTPNELVRALLRAPVDLLWLGGIGTFVKAREETHAEVGDHANDATRINADELNCKIVAEGANLGFTQRARIAFALRGGRINTDAIDNSAGVDCSDHEVNIKIALDRLVADGALTVEQRNRLLVELTDDIAELVLRDNELQTQALSIAEHRSPLVIESHARLIRRLEREGKLNREVEFLPNDEEIARREQEGLGLTRPELAILLAYAKLDLYHHLLETDVDEDAYLAQDLVRYFPPKLARLLGDAVYAHRLRREIVATSVANSVINRTGPAFLHRTAEEAGAAPAEVARAYAVARSVFDLRTLWDAIEGAASRVPSALQMEMFAESQRLIERGTFWFLRNCPRPIDIAASIEAFGAGVAELSGALEELLAPEELASVTKRREALAAQGAPDVLARRIAIVDGLIPACGIVHVARGIEHPVRGVGRTYFALGETIGFDWLRERSAELKPRNHWQRRAIAALVDDFYSQQTALASAVLKAAKGREGADAVAAWIETQRVQVERTNELLSDMRKADQLDVAMLAVANRQFRALIVG